MGALASFGDDNLVASKEIDIIGLEQMLTKEAPEELRPGQGGSEETLDGAIAAAVARPARNAQHRDPPGHGQDGQGNAVQLARRGCGQTRVEAVEQC